MTWVAGVLVNCLTPPGIEVLDGRELSPSDLLGRTNFPLVGCQSVTIRRGDAASQDALNSAAV